MKEALSRAGQAGRFPHALLLCGEPGCGKLHLCPGCWPRPLSPGQGATPPDGACPSCVRAKAGSHPDIRVVEGSGVTRSLSVEAVKEVTADAYRAPEEAEVSVYILLMGTRTLEPAQNKLLKLIEEPPPHGVFILVCASAEQLLPTIRSRVQAFVLEPPSQEEAAAYMAARRDIPLERARQLAALCGGNIGRMERSSPAGKRPGPFPLPRPWPRAC